MTWLRLDDAFADHPKVVGLSDAAFRLHVMALCYCNKHLTDGHIPVGAVAGWRMQKEARELVRARLWRSRKDGFTVKDYLEYNPSRSEVQAKRDSKRLAGAKGAAKRYQAVRHDPPDSHIHKHIPPTYTSQDGVLENTNLEGGVGGGHPVLDGFELSEDQAHLLESLPGNIAESLIPVLAWGAKRYGQAPTTEGLRAFRSAVDSGLAITNAAGFLSHHIREQFTLMTEEAK